MNAAAANPKPSPVRAAACCPETLNPYLWVRPLLPRRRSLSSRHPPPLPPHLPHPHCVLLLPLLPCRHRCCRRYRRTSEAAAGCSGFRKSRFQCFWNCTRVLHCCRRSCHPYRRRARGLLWHVQDSNKCRVSGKGGLCELLGLSVPCSDACLPPQRAAHLQFLGFRCGFQARKDGASIRLLHVQGITIGQPVATTLHSTRALPGALPCCGHPSQHSTAHHSTATLHSACVSPCAL